MDYLDYNIIQSLCTRFVLVFITIENDIILCGARALSYDDGNTDVAGCERGNSGTRSVERPTTNAVFSSTPCGFSAVFLIRHNTDGNYPLEELYTKAYSDFGPSPR